MRTIAVNVAGLQTEETITLRLVGVRVLSARFRLGALLVRLADRVLPCRVVLVEDEPPVTAYDVAVEKVGGEMRLRIGDRGVRLDRHDAKHIGGLLECNWVGTAHGMRADDAG